MKKIIFVIALASVLLLGGCDLFGPVATTTEETSQGTTITTDDTTMTTQPSSNTESTTIINDEIHLRLNAGQDTVEFNTEWTDAGAVFVVNDTEYDMTTTDTVDPSSLGLYTITYTYEYEGQTYSIDRYVNVVDQTPPEINLIAGVDTVKVGDEWTDPGWSYDGTTGEILTAEVTGTVNTEEAGTYVITYTVTDESGNSTTLKRYVTVIE